MQVASEREVQMCGMNCFLVADRRWQVRGTSEVPGERASDNSAFVLAASVLDGKLDGIGFRQTEAL